MTPTAEITRRQVIHSTPLGPMVSTWTDNGLFSLCWDSPGDIHPGDIDDGADGVGPEELEDRLEEYFATGRADFRSIVLDTEGWTPFTRHVYQCCRSIAPGETVTYKELARRAGNAAASRAVGAAMSRNRVLLVVPCHRVISSGGGLRGFSAPGGLQTKQFLLDLETK